MDIIDHIVGGGAAAGFDLVQPLQVGWYNQVVEPSYALPDFGRPESLAVLIGNTRRMWERFGRSLRARPALLDDPDPVDRYTVASLRPVLEGLRFRWEVRWAHEPPPRRVAMQRLADVSGLAWLSPGFLNVHRVYGPWIALRAAVVVDAPGPSARSGESSPPCLECAHACRSAFEEAVAAGDRTSGDTWRLWLKVRDTCPVGRTYRYSEEQIEYHYRKDPMILRRVIEDGRD